MLDGLEAFMMPVYSQTCRFFSLSTRTHFLYFSNNTHIVGDAAYPLSRFVMTPYKDNGYLSPIEKNYNFVQSSTKTVVERAFGLLKGKFAHLQYLNVKSVYYFYPRVHYIISAWKKIQAYMTMALSLKK